MSQAIPEMTKAAWAAKKKDIQTLQKGMTRRRYVYRIKMAAYQKDFHDQYKKPGFGARFLAFLFRLVPKIGPFKALSFRVPPPAAETMFVTSLDDTIREYKTLLASAGANQLQLRNQNFDTGQPTPSVIIILPTRLTPNSSSASITTRCKSPRPCKPTSTRFTEPRA